MFEIHRDPTAYVGLHLPQTPVRFARMAHQHSGFQHVVQAGHPVPLCPPRVALMEMELDLSALLGSRICHDLISPLGAIANGVELLLMTGAAASPEVALIAESVANANARIRFFRVAYGMASAEQRMGRPEILSVLTDVTTGTRLSFDWQVAGDVPRIEVKLAYLALQCCETAMPYGGKIMFTRDGTRWRIKATAAKFKADPDLWAALKQMAVLADLSSAQLQFALLVQLLHQQGRKLALDMSATDIVIGF